MRRVFIILIAFSFPLFSISQNDLAIGQNHYNIQFYDSKRQTNFIGELGGNGLLFSLGMEHAKFNNKTLKNTFRWGFSFLPVTTYSLFGEYNVDFGKNKNYFEIGTGPTLYWDQGLDLILCGRIGYRYISDRFIFRIGFTPILLMNNEFGFSPYYGISLGLPLKQFR